MSDATAWNNPAYNKARKQVRGMPCHWCGAPPPSEADHLRPVALGGDSTPTNIVPACRPCNAARGVRTRALLDRWRGATKRRWVVPNSRQRNTKADNPFNQ